MASDREPAEQMVYISRGEGEERIERKIRKSQINTERLAVMFGLEKSSIHLVEEFRRDTEWSNREGRFDLSAFSDGSCFQVEGTRKIDNVFGRSISPGLSTCSSTSKSTNRTFSPNFNSVLPHAAAKRAKLGYSLKVTVASLENGKIKNPSRQLYVLISEDTANVPYIGGKCAEELEITNNCLKLVTANGLPLEDSDGTRGLAFWKSTSRKVYAVTIKPHERKDDVVIIKEEDDDSASKTSQGDLLSSVEKLMEVQTVTLKSLCEQMMDEMKKTSLETTMDLNAKLFVTRALQNTFLQKVVDCFKCVICHATAKPTIVFGSCCGNILGCETCLHQWYQGSETCPKCRGEEGFNKLHVVRGFDDILVNLRG